MILEELKGSVNKGILKGFIILNIALYLSSTGSKYRFTNLCLYSSESSGCGIGMFSTEEWAASSMNMIS